MHKRRLIPGEEYKKIKNENAKLVYCTTNGAEVRTLAKPTPSQMAEFKKRAKEYCSNFQLIKVEGEVTEVYPNGLGDKTKDFYTNAHLFEKGDFLGA